jgi:hypothetical protein
MFGMFVFDAHEHSVQTGSGATQSPAQYLHLSLWGGRTRRPLHRGHILSIVASPSYFIISDSSARALWHLAAEVSITEAEKNLAKKEKTNFA